jgi:glutathione S-transferase
MALAAAGLEFEIREVVLRDKPKELLTLSSKATVPVLDLGHTVIDESLDIIKWSLAQNDPAGWMRFDNNQLANMAALIDACDSGFKRHLDHYKYSDRYPAHPLEDYRNQCLPFLETLNRQLESNAYLFAGRISYADIAICPFVRQFANVDAAWFGSLALPGVQRWLSELLESERFKSIMTKYPQWRAGDAATIFHGALVSDSKR